MNRRRLLVRVVSAIASAAVLGQKALAQPARISDYDVFKKLGRVLAEIASSTQSFAQIIDAARFNLYLAAVATGIDRLIELKGTVLRDLSATACAASDSKFQAAKDSAHQMLDVLKRLSNDTDRLALAISPDHLQAATREAASGIRDLALVRKQWAARVPEFCQLAPSGRSGLIEEANASLVVLKDVQRQVDDLIEKSKLFLDPGAPIS